MELPNLLIRDVEKRLKSIIKKLTHSGEDQLNKQLLRELRQICKVSKDDIVIYVTKECFKCLKKEHSQVRLACVKLFNYLFQKSHVVRTNVVNRLDIFMELSLAISVSPEVELKLPPPKIYASLLKELSTKFLHQWYTEFGPGYERLRYTYKYLQEHGLVNFSQFRVRTHEQLINERRMLEKQERILSQSIQNRLDEFPILKSEIEELVIQIESVLDALIPNQSDMFINSNTLDSDDDDTNHDNSATNSKKLHGFINLNNNINISFSPFVELEKNLDNKEIIDSLRELKRQLVDKKLPKLIGIEKVITKRSEQFVGVLKKIIDLKIKCTNSLQKLGELKIIDECKNPKTLDKAHDDSDDSGEFEEVSDKPDLESYIPKNMRYEYGLEPIDPRELQDKSYRTTDLVDESFSVSVEPIPSTSSATLTQPCNVRLETGKLCPRRDKIKCPFHGRIIARDHNGIPIDEEERRLEEMRAKKKTRVPDWQDPEFLEDIRLATGIDLKMPEKTKRKLKEPTKLLNKRTCDVTPKQRLQQKLQKLRKLA